MDTMSIRWEEGGSKKASTNDEANVHLWVQFLPASMGVGFKFRPGNTKKKETAYAEGQKDH